VGHRNRAHQLRNRFDEPLGNAEQAINKAKPIAETLEHISLGEGKGAAHVTLACIINQGRTDTAWKRKRTQHATIRSGKQS
jgi:hypothetical protein